MGWRKSGVAMFAAERDADGLEQGTAYRSLTSDDGGREEAKTRFQNVNVRGGGKMKKRNLV